MNMEMLHENSILESAHRYLAMELPILPLKGKIPAVRDWQEFVATTANVDYWFGSVQANIGMRTGHESGYVVVDTDTPEAEEWVREHLPETPMQALSGAGSRHRYFSVPPRKEIRNKQGWKRTNGLDVRGSGGFIVLPGSIHPETGRPYEWLTPMLRPEELPRFSPSWVYERRRTVQTAVEETIAEPGTLRYRGERYIDTFDKRAVSGSNGHTTAFVGLLKVVSFVRRLGGTEHDAWQLGLYLNATKCDPPWDLSDPDEERQWRHKFNDALKKAR